MDLPALMPNADSTRRGSSSIAEKLSGRLAANPGETGMTIEIDRSFLRGAVDGPAQGDR